MVKANFICKPVFNLVKKDKGAKWINLGGSNNRKKIKKMKELWVDEFCEEIKLVLIVKWLKKTDEVRQ